MKNTYLDRLKVSLDDSLSDVVTCIQASGSLGCALIYNHAGRFVNIVTDGDVRRAFLEGKHLDATARDILQIKLKTARPTPITAHVGSTHAERTALFRRYSLRQLILVDRFGTPVDIIDHLSINSSPAYVNQRFTAVVMAGGFGTRRPLTENTPKPMLHVNGRPMLEISIEKLVNYGATRIFISTHYLREKIVDHFGSGERFGVPIDYIHEEEPLGTGGALPRLSYRDDTTLVFNGDILTNLDFGMFLAYHLRSQSAVTIAATQYSFQVPFGVVSMTESQVTHNVWLARHHRRLVAIARDNPDETYRWRDEVWPLQWRLAINWLCGYLLTQINVPILFHTHGAVVAGQFGLSLTIVNTIGLISQSWLLRHVPGMAQAAAVRDWRLLDRLFWCDFGVTLGVFAAGATGFLGLVSLMADLQVYTVSCRGRNCSDSSSSLSPASSSAGSRCICAASAANRLSGSVSLEP
jgi:UDP-2,4-diacetamido-2,4,6-trideoxy-beta-L-gulopyranose hydrolase